MIDIGSSMVRLVVYDTPPGGYPHLYLNHRVWTLLGKGKGLGDVFSLSEEAMARTLAALEWFVWVCSQSEVERVVAVASSAVREAVNGADFVEAARRTLGLHVEMISGETEALLAAAGAVAGMPDAHGVVLDMGGGSLELCAVSPPSSTGGVQTNGNARHQGWYRSLPLGVVALREKNPSTPVGACDILCDELGACAVPKARDVLALGAGMRSIARTHMAECGYPLRIVHDYRVPAEDMIPMCEKWLRHGLPPETAPGAPGEWLALLPYRAAGLLAVLRASRAKQVRFATFGLREGVLFAELEQDVMDGHPLLAFAKDAARRDGHGVLCGMDATDWVKPLFPQVSLNLLRAAALMAETVWREQAAYRGVTLFNAVCGAAFAGCSHEERAWLAAACYFRHEDEGFEALRSRLTGLLTEADIASAKAVGAALHLAAVLDPGHRGAAALSEFKLCCDAVKGIGCALHGPAPFMAMRSETVERRVKHLSACLENMGR